MRIRDVIKKLEEVKGQLEDLEARIPSIVSTAIIMAFHNPGVLKQLYAIYGLQVSFSLLLPAVC
jgi:hypothetical protein